MDDPFVGEERSTDDGGRMRSLVKALPGGALHMMGPQAQFVRRLTLRRTDQPACAPAGAFVEGLVFCQPGRGLWSWFALPAYFPQMALLPTLEGIRADGLEGHAAVEARLLKERDHLLTHLRSGRSDGNQISGSVMGWSHPRGYSHGGAVSGVDIGFVEGHRTAWAASHAGYERLQALHRMSLARQPDAQYALNGDPIGLEGWLDAQGRVPFDFRQNGYMVPHEFQYVCKRGPAPNAHVAEVARRKLRPPYDPGNPHQADGEIPRQKEALFAWMHHDDQHMIRHSKNLKALVWLGNDPLAKDGLRHVASLFRLWFHDRPHIPVDWSHGITLRNFTQWAQKFPGHGLPIGREHAWGMDISAAEYQLASPATRANRLPWITKIVELFEIASMPSGLIKRVNQPDLFERKYDATQTFQLMFLLHAQRCFNESIFRGAHEDLFERFAALHNKGLEFLFFGYVFTHYEGERWGTQVSEAGPYHRFAVGPSGRPRNAPFLRCLGLRPRVLARRRLRCLRGHDLLAAALGIWLLADPRDHRKSAEQSVFAAFVGSGVQARRLQNAG